MNGPVFLFQPRWREELVCTCAEGSLVIEMTMGAREEVCLPSEATWQKNAPEWARPLWSSLESQLRSWCGRTRPLHIEDRAWVSEERV